MQCKPEGELIGCWGEVPTNLKGPPIQAQIMELSECYLPFAMLYNSAWAFRDKKLIVAMPMSRRTRLLIPYMDFILRSEIISNVWGQE